MQQWVPLELEFLCVFIENVKYCCNQKAAAVVAPWLTTEDNNLLIYVKKHICLMEKSIE